jgi:hypothetical protein
VSKGNFATFFYIGDIDMTEHKLVEFISLLTEEEIDKIIAELPRLTAMLGESVRPYPPERSEPTP